MFHSKQSDTRAIPSNPCSRSFFLFLVLYNIVGQFSGSPSSTMSFSDSRYHLTALTGYFQQSEGNTDASVFDYAKHNFGLIDRSYNTDAEFDPEGKKTQWERFAHYVGYLRQQAESAKEDYRVLYLGRHGQGWHNVAESYYGTVEWDRYYSKVEGGTINDNKSVTWADAHLTDQGIADALAVNAFWKQGLSVAKIPAPETYYTSPLHRCCATANLSFSGLDLPKAQPFVPEIRELLRETNGEHTCDRRSTASYIASEFPSYDFERGFSENDELWKPDERETKPAMTARLHRALEDIFEKDGAAFVSVTSHSGAIAAVLRALAHREFALPTGGVMPVFVRVERKG